MEQPFGVFNYIIDYALFFKFYRFHSFKGYRKLLTVVIYIFATVGILLGLLTLMLDFEVKMLGLMAILVFVLVMKLYHDFCYPKTLYKNSRVLYEATQQLQLFTEYFHIISSGAQTSGEVSTQYEALNSAFETDDMFYLYITKHQAYLFPKGIMDKDAVAKLRSVLDEKLGEKFRVV